MGGSPGNFGILTHVRLLPLHDKDYPDSRMMKFNTDYTPEKHQAVTALFAEMSGDEDFPRNYCYAITVMSPVRPQNDGPKTFNLKEAQGSVDCCKLKQAKATTKLTRSDLINFN